MRGTIYYDQGKLDQAVSDYSQAITIKPQEPQGYMSRALIYLRESKANEAISDLNTVLAIDPNNSRAYFNRAVGYFQLKQYDRSWSDVHKTQDLRGTLNPDFITALKQAK